MSARQIADKEIDGIKITNIFEEASYYFRTSGYNYEFHFRCDLTDPDVVYALCKKAFSEGKDHVRYDGTIGTYVVDHDSVRQLRLDSKYDVPFIKKGCNWVYCVNEGNDN